MFCERVKIKYSDLAPDKKAGLPSILRFFQDAAINHSSSSGFSLYKLYDMSRAWILISMNVTVARYPQDGEEIEVCTYTTGFDKFYGNRCFSIKDKNGAEIAKAASLWILVNTKTGRPARVPDDIMEHYGQDKNPDAEYIHREPPLRSGEPVCSISVGQRDIDTNNHVNNVRLEEFAAEALPEGTVVKKAIIFYRSSVRMGNTIIVHSSKQDNVYDVILKDEEGKTYTSAKFYTASE